MILLDEINQDFQCCQKVCKVPYQVGRSWLPNRTTCLWGLAHDGSSPSGTDWKQQCCQSFGVRWAKLFIPNANFTDNINQMVKDFHKTENFNNCFYKIFCIEHILAQIDDEMNQFKPFKSIDKMLMLSSHLNQDQQHIKIKKNWLILISI